MTHPAEVVDRAAELLAEGLSQAEVARRTGVSRAVIRDWVSAGLEMVAERRRTLPSLHPPGACPWVPRMTDVGPQYAYLLGLYLGDGHIAHGRKDVYALRIVFDLKYPNLIGEGYRAMRAVLPNRVCRVMRIGCLNLVSYSKHWPCLFPQHGPGFKHTRPIMLTDWQREIAVQRHPEWLVRGLVHSDGCRVINRVRVRGVDYVYSRYMFSNRSIDIQEIFRTACHQLGIEARNNNPWELSVARRPDVELLDRFVGPKT